MNKNILIIGIISLFILSALAPMVFGYNVIKTNKLESESTIDDKGLIDHIWPMEKNNAQRTGRSVYNASHNKGGEKWKYPVYLSLWGAATIDKNGIIYVGTPYDGLHAIYPNGTRKWHVDLVGREYQAPVIAPDGTIYVGTMSWFYAFYPNGTLKWKFDREGNFFNNPVVDSNSTVYVSTQEGYIYVIYSNGTLKWELYVADFASDIALDKDENIYYSGYFDNRLFCYSPNGSLKWTYNQVGIRDGPVIDSEGIIYIRSSKLTALYPNGTRKWYINFSDFYGMPSIAPDGTIILSTDGCEYITALDPSDASVIWQYKIAEWAPLGGVSFASIDNCGTIYFAYDAYGNDVAFLVALNPDGTLKWETSLTTEIHPYQCVDIMSTPSIGSDGTVYITSWFSYSGSGPKDCYIHAIGMDNPVVPEPPTISGPSNVKQFSMSEYTLKSNLPAGIDVYYLIDWDDKPPNTDYPNNWIGPFPSDEAVKVEHFWELLGNHKIKVKIKTDDSLCSQSIFDVNVEKFKDCESYNSGLILKFLERFPMLQKILIFLTI